MATSAQQVFDIAMGLMDEVNGNSGATDTSDTKEYKQRTLFILTALRGELYPYSDTYTAPTSGKRPIARPITDFTAAIDLDDFLCQSVMPYGLAAQLLLNEDAAAASFMQQRYEELIQRYGRGIPQGSENIENVYGGIEHGEYSVWG